MNLVKYFQEATNEGRILSSIEELLTDHPSYEALRGELKRYRNVQTNGKWPTVPGGASLRTGDRSDRIITHKNRLHIERCFLYPENEEDIEFYEEKLGKAVKKFQEDRGLKSDGIVGPATLEELNQTPSQRVSQIEINMERLRWLPEALGNRYVVVNIVNFKAILLLRIAGY